MSDDFLGNYLKKVSASTSNTVKTVAGGLINSAEDVARNKLGIIGDLIFGPDENRLRSAGLNRGAEPDSITAFSPSAGAEADTRVKILTPSFSTIRTSIFESNILSPLRYTDFGVVFPFQPNLSVMYAASYTMQQPTQTNYPYPAYDNSMIQSIIVPGEFSASNIDEARYVLAAIHFFRTATKSYYGQDANAGTPPPVLRLKGGGRYMFDNVPVVITDFNYVLPDDVDYIPVNTNDVPPGQTTLTGSNSITMVPTSTVLNITLQPLYSRQEISERFSVREFAKGNLISNGSRGGFI